MFAEATDDPEGVFSLTEFDGILGLGYVAIAVMEVTPALYNMYQQELIPQLAFSMYVNEVKGEQLGRVVWGGSDERLQLYLLVMTMFFLKKTPLLDSTTRRSPTSTC